MSQYATIVRKVNMEIIAMAEQQEHPLNRHLFIADNLNLLRALDSESIDLICIDLPFAKNQTFTGSLRPNHNTLKNSQRVHLADYRTEIADTGEMMVNTTGELIDLAEAQHKAMQMYGRAYAARYGVG